MTAARRSWGEGFWLLTLLPAVAVVALDLASGVVRPGTWLTRALPALVWIGVVFATRVLRSPLALQLRAELRLALPTALLLQSSGAVLVQDAVASPAVNGLLAVMPWVLGAVLPVAAVTIPMSIEHERGTLEALLASPGGGRVFARKFALGAGLVVTSWLLLSGAPVSGDAWWFALAGHVLAVATVPTWFFLARAEAATLGLSVLVPYFLAAPVALLAPGGLRAFGLGYAAVVLALLPWAVRRGVGRGPHPWVAMNVPGLGRGSRWPWLREQRDAGWLALAGGVAAALVWGRGNPEAAVYLLFYFGVLVAVLSASLAFSGPRGEGTLELEVVALPRRRVWLRRATTSLAVTAVLSVVAPLATVAVLAPVSLKVALLWALAVAVAWSIGLAVAVHVAGVGTGLVGGLGAVLALFLLNGWGFVLSFLAVAGEGAAARPNGVALPVALAVPGALALWVALERFVKADRVSWRRVGAAAATSVACSVLCGALSVVGR